LTCHRAIYSVWIYRGYFTSARTGFEITRSFASGAASAAALARSRTIEAFVLNRSVPLVRLLIFPSRFSKHTIASHSRLSRYTSGDEDDLSADQGFLESGWCRVITSDCALCVDMADISSNTYFVAKKRSDGLMYSLYFSSERTWASSNIVQGELSDTRVKLHQERQWLTDATCCAEDGDFGKLVMQKSTN
jgi:hypothetical protein